MEDFKLYFATGWEHIISLDAIDHLLFIFALGAIYSIKHIKQVAILVTAFTIGHSITLALSTFDVIQFNSNWVEFLIPVTICLTAATNIIKRTLNNISIHYGIALCFGLIHGMGFANTIRFMLAKGQAITIPLFSFNLGLEVGQLIVVFVILGLHWFFVEGNRLQRKYWVASISIFTFFWGAWLAWQRIP